MVEVEPFDQMYVNGAVPPVLEAAAVPSLAAHVVFVEVADAERLQVQPLVTVTVAVAVHPLASVTKTLYPPLVKPVAVLVATPLLQEYVYGVAPPEGETVAVPSLPAQVRGVAVAVVAKPAQLVVQPLPTAMVAVLVQLFASVMVTK